MGRQAIPGRRQDKGININVFAAELAPRWRQQRMHHRARRAHRESQGQKLQQMTHESAKQIRHLERQWRRRVQPEEGVRFVPQGRTLPARRRTGRSPRPAKGSRPHAIIARSGRLQFTHRRSPGHAQGRPPRRPSWPAYANTPGRAKKLVSATGGSPIESDKRGGRNVKTPGSVAQNMREYAGIGQDCQSAQAILPTSIDKKGRRPGQSSGNAAESRRKSH